MIVSAPPCATVVCYYAVCKRRRLNRVDVSHGVIYRTDGGDKSRFFPRFYFFFIFGGLSRSQNTSKKPK